MTSLITKLPGNITDETLGCIDEIGFKVVNSAVEKITFVVYSPSTNTLRLRLVGGSYFTDSTGAENYGTEFNTTLGTGSYTVYVSAGESLLFINNKENIASFVPGSTTSVYMAYSDLRYCSKWVTLTLNFAGYENEPVKAKDIALPGMLNFYSSERNRLEGDISDLQNLDNLADVNVTLSPKFVGDVSALSNNANLTILTLNGCSLSGDISAFGKAVKMTNLQLNSNAGINGTIESMLDAMKANGRKNSTIRFLLTGTGVTCEGEVPTVMKKAVFDSNGNYTITDYS